MIGQRAYLDYNASSLLRPKARAAMIDALNGHGNASSVHGEGRDQKRLIEAARRQVADLANVDVEGVIFTSSATEAADLALTPNIYSNGTFRPASKLYVLATEHPCVLAGGRFAPEDVITIPVLENGLADSAAFEALLEVHDFDIGLPFLALQLVNSETGIIQPVADLAQMVRFKGGYGLCDCVQAAGRLPLDAAALGVDFILLSAHKIGGPQGVGALLNASPILSLDPSIRGGGQEKNRRAGTENVAGIVGFGAACELALQDALDYSKITELRDSIQDRLMPICKLLGLSERLTVFGDEQARVGNTLLFSLNGLSAETALIAFDLEGVAVSSGSACSSGKVGSSHVLSAMQVDEGVAKGAIRLSLGWQSSAQDSDKFITAFERIARRLSERIGAEPTLAQASVG